MTKLIQAGRCCVTLRDDGSVTIHDMHDDANRFDVTRPLLAATTAESCDALAEAFSEMAAAMRGRR